MKTLRYSLRALAALLSYPGAELRAHLPELIAAIDEGTHDESPRLYGHEIERARHRWGDDLVQVRHFEVDVPNSVIRDAFGTGPITVDAPVRHIEEDR